MKRPLRALLVEDSQDDAELLLRELARIGFRVEHLRVDTAAGMQAALTEREWDLVLSDYTMPEFDAHAALRILKDSGIDMPFIIVSGAIGEETAVGALKAGAHDFLVKGRLTRLLPAIDRELREAAMRRERREAIAQVQERESRLSAIFSQVAVGFALTDLDGRIRSANQRFCDIVGRSAEELVALRDEEMTHPEDAEGTAGAFGRLVSGESSQLEKRYVRPDGTAIWVNQTLSSVIGTDGRPEHSVAVVQDITDRKRAEEELREAVQARDEFLSIASHELRTPVTALELNLTSILPLARSGRLAGDGQEKLAGKLERAARQVDRLSTLINSLLDVTRITASRLSLCPVDVDLAELVRSVVTRFREVIERSECPLVLQHRRAPHGAMGPDGARDRGWKLAVERDQVRQRPADRGDRGPAGRRRSPCRRRPRHRDPARAAEPDLRPLRAGGVGAPLRRFRHRVVGRPPPGGGPRRPHRGGKSARGGLTVHREPAAGRRVGVGGGGRGASVLAVVVTGLVDDVAEMDRLLEGIRASYGYDFTGYARDTLCRRLARHLVRVGLPSLARLRSLVLSDGAAFARVLDDLTIQVTEMFRDPEFYEALRRGVAPFLRSYPSLRIWIAGCASGEEAHSAAIVLHEEGLLERTIIYGTDVNPAVVRRARDGIYPADRIRHYAENYRRAGGAGSFTSYFTVAHGYAAVAPWITQRVHFAEHNLVCDEVFGEMNAIMCRNVLIYFNADLQDHALGVLGRSLIQGGFLCLGSREGLRSSHVRRAYEDFAPESRIYRKRHDFART